MDPSKSTPVKHHEFHAIYDYGNKSEQIKKQNPIINFINSLIVRLFKPLIFPGASFLRNRWIDPERTAIAEQQLKSVGGQKVTLKTPDGDKIDGMYLDATTFKSSIEKFCDLIETDNDLYPHPTGVLDGTVKQQFVLKPEYYEIVEEEKDGKITKTQKPKPEAEAFLKNIKGLGLETSPAAIQPGKENTRGPIINLGNIPKSLKNNNQAVKNTSNPTVLLAPGSGMTFAAYKGLAASYLLRGINVMMVDYRGYGQSGGTPTDHKLKLDLESAYQYLKTEKHVKNSDLIIHGHCLGGGPASDLAARRPGVNLILDRTYSDYREVARERIPLLRGLIHRILPTIVNFNNSENLKKTEGNVAIEMDIEDAVIPENQITKLIDSLPESRGKNFKLMWSDQGHTGLWTNNLVTGPQFNSFLDQCGLRRKLF